MVAVMAVAAVTAALVFVRVSCGGEAAVGSGTEAETAVVQTAAADLVSVAARTSWRVVA